MKFHITGEDAGMCVREFLCRRAGLSRAMLKHLKFIENGICVNGAHVTVRHQLSEGEVLEIASEDTAPSEKITPCELEVGIVYEDDSLVVPSKPPFMPTHPSRDHYFDTLANALAYKYKDGTTPFVFRPVNRLDRNTSGLVLVAKNRLTASKLFASMKRGEIRKEYITLLRGTLPEQEGEIETHMKRTDESIIVRRVCRADEGGDYALTKYRVLYSDGVHSLVLASPVTGRTHQLRVHFAHLGAPIVGDDMYGEESKLISRQALHAARLVFTHPESGETLFLTSPLPSDMCDLVTELFGASFELDGILSNTEKK